jgi:hypothetical protein
MHTVHVRVNDAATSKPTPVRIRFLDLSGRAFAPFGRSTEFATSPGEDLGGSVRVGAARFAYIDGTCEVALPAGPVTVEAFKGPEYLPLQREVTLGPGQISLRLSIERRMDLRSDGWYSGDVRCHDLPPHAALLEGSAEGLAFVHLLARQRPPAAFPNLLAFSSTRPALQTESCSVVVNTLNVHPVLGTVALLNCHRIVYPLRSGDSADDWSVADWCDQCHRKNGLVVWPDLPRLTPEHPQGEALAALLLGKVDAFEIASFPDVEPQTLGDWYRLLDCGCRLPLVGGSGKDSNAQALGAVRTYAHLQPGHEPSVKSWIEAVRAGRTFVTNGPLLFLAADGTEAGAVLQAPAQGRVIRIRAEACSAVPFDHLEVLAGGSVVASKTASGNRLQALVETELPVHEPTWMAARCWSQERVADGQCCYAHTSPIHVEVEGRRPRPGPATAAPLQALLEQTQTWLRQAARCPTEQQRTHIGDVLRQAVAVLATAGGAA